jgi:predicted Zn-dependent protease
MNVGISLIAFCLAAHAAEMPIDTLIKPGYVPGSDAKVDERGIWMEMAEAERWLTHSPLLVKDLLIAKYVEEIACQVAGEFCSDLRVYLVRNPLFNASMAPNGTMIVHTGLLARTTSADQLAAVLGHELAHYTQTHSIKRLRAAKSRLTAGAIISMGLAVGGVSAGGLPEIIALTSVMGFTREQESDADLLGTYFMGQAGYSIDAAAELWLMLTEEEEHASVKHPKGPLFMSSHPSPTRRAARLAEYAQSHTDRLVQPPDDDGLFQSVLQESYSLLMDEQILARDHGRTQLLLDRHEHLGINPADIAFYRGEALRHRGEAGDHELAMAEYRKAVEGASPNSRAYRELGYLELKQGAPELAKEHFRQFLASEPQATDREMIEFYLED